MHKSQFVKMTNGVICRIDGFNLLNLSTKPRPELHSVPNVSFSDFQAFEKEFLYLFAQLSGERSEPAID